MTNITLDERLGSIGASESAGLLGCSPYTTPLQLYFEKRGEVSQVDLDDVERVQAGFYLEPAIAAWASKKFDLNIRSVQRYIRHPAIHRMGASLDYETVKNHYPVEIKNVDSLVFYKEWAEQDGYITDAPIHILLQIQHQMEVAGKDKAILIVCVGGNRLYLMKTARREKTAKMLTNEIIKFWGMVDNNIQPPPDFERDGALLASSYPIKAKAADFTGDKSFEKLCSKYSEARKTEKINARIKERCKNELIWKMEMAELAFCDGYKATLTTNKKHAVTFRLTKIGGDFE